MTRIIDAVYGALYDTLHNVGSLLVLNLLTTVCLFPLLAIVTVVLTGSGNLGAFPLTICLIVGVLPCPAVLPLHMIANRIARGDLVMFARDSREALTRFGLKALGVWCISLAVAGVLAANIAFYSGTHIPLAVGFRYVCVSLLVVWLCIHLYALPLVIENRTSGVLDTYRKAFALALMFPGFTLAIALVWIAMVGLFGFTGILAVLGLALTVSLQQQTMVALFERDLLAPE
jgi:hypothetical protein